MNQIRWCKAYLTGPYKFGLTGQDAPRNFHCWTPLLIGSQGQLESRATASVSRPSSIECFHHGVWLNHQLRGYKFPKVEAKYFHGGFQGHGIPAKIISIKLHCFLFAWDLPFCMGTYLFAWGPTFFQWEPTWEQKLTKNTMKGYRPCYNLLFMDERLCCWWPIPSINADSIKRSPHVRIMGWTVSRLKDIKWS